MPFGRALSYYFPGIGAESNQKAFTVPIRRASVGAGQGPSTTPATNSRMALPFIFFLSSFSPSSIGSFLSLNLYVDIRRPSHKELEEWPICDPTHTHTHKTHSQPAAEDFIDSDALAHIHHIASEYTHLIRSVKSFLIDNFRLHLFQLKSTTHQKYLYRTEMIGRFLARC